MKQSFLKASEGVLFFQYINTLSIDVAMGSMVSASFFGVILGVESSLYELIGLGLIVWFIYTVDHLLDAVDHNVPAVTHRHRFHRKHVVKLFFAAILIALIAVSLIFFIRSTVIVWGSVLGVFVVIYFVFQRRLGFLKEISGALLYTTGVLLPSMSLLTAYPSTPAIIFIVLFAIVVWTNLTLFSWLSADRSRSVRQIFLVFCPMRGRGRIVFYGFFTISFILSVYCGIAYPNRLSVVLIVSLMNVVLLIIFVRSSWFMKHDRYRIAGDAVFLFPLLHFLYYKN